MLKRVFDFLCAFFGLLFLSPLLLAAAVFVKLTSKGPVFFMQSRVGRNGEEFRLFKFRTMRVSEPGLKITKSGDPRITLFGKVLRKTKIDELPQLINVLKGDMALVGPRPEVRDYVDPDDPLWQVVLKVKPGITDPVTLRLRNEEEFLAKAADSDKFYRETLQRFKLQGYSEYVAKKSFLGDLKIIFYTLASVFIPSLYPPPGIEEIEEGWKKGGTA